MRGKSYKSIGIRILRRVTSAVLVAVMFFTMVGIYIPAETFKAADSTVILAGNWGEFAGSNLASWNPTNMNAKMESKGNGYYYIKITFNQTTATKNAAFKAILGTAGWSSPNIGGIDGNIDGDGNYVVSVPAGSTSIEIIADTTNKRLYNSIEHPDKIDVVLAGHKVTTHKMVVLAGNFASFGSYPDWNPTSTGLRMQELGDGYYFACINFDASKSGQDAKFKAMFGGNGWSDPQIGGVSGNQDGDGNYVIKVPTGNTSLIVIADTKNSKLYNSIQHSSNLSNILKTYGSVELISKEILVEEGSSAQISHTIKPVGSTVVPTYTSGNTSIATVDNTGKVTGVSAGETYVRVSLNTNNYVDCKVVVSAQPVVYEVDIVKDTLSIQERESETLAVTFSPENAGLTWSSSAPTVATVDTNGKVTAVAAGSAIITAEAPDGTKDTCTVTVTERPTYTYTVYTYTSNSEHFNKTNAELYIFDKESPKGFADYEVAFSEIVTLADGNTWLKATVMSKSKHIGLIFKENHQGDTWGWKTPDYIYQNSEAKDQTLYIVEGIDGIVFTEIPAVTSPVVDGSNVTFTYYNSAGYEALYLRGTFNGWGESPMVKGDGMFSLTLQLEPGIYDYKFWSGGDNWFADPLNTVKSTTSDDSRVIITGFKDAQTEMEKGVVEMLPSTLQYVSASGTITKATVSYALKETYEEGMVSLENRTFSVNPSFEEDSIVLEISATVGGKKVTGEYTVRLANKMFTYTIYAHSAMEARNAASAMGLWIWDAADQSLLKDQELTFTEVELNGQKWLKTTIETTAYKKLGLILKSKGAEVWTWQTTDIYFSNSSQTENVDIYLVDGYPTAYTSLNKVPEDRYIYVEYKKEDGNYSNTNVYAWNTGYVGKEDGKEVNYSYAFKAVNGKYVAKIPVVVGNVEKRVGFLVRTGYNDGDDWTGCVKDGGDNYVTINAEQEYVKVRFQNGAISYVLPDYVGGVINRKKNTISFYYRDEASFLNNTLANIGTVELHLRVKTGSDLYGEYKYTMEYDAANERYFYSFPLTEDTDYYYYYKVNGTTVLDTTNTRTETIGDVTYSLRRNKVYHVNVLADVTNDEMKKANNKEMDYEDNAVLSVRWEPKVANDPLEGFYVEKVYADLSALGLGTKVEIDKDLMEITFGCLDSIEPGEKTIKVTLEDDCGMSYTGTTTVKIVEREKAANTATKLGDFDWDEAVIYFAVTDRFFDGDSSNNPTNEVSSKVDGSLYHGGDLKGLTQKIQYLYDLGVNTIWITPIVDNIDQNVMSDTDVNESYGYHGYWTSDFTKLNPHLGTEAELKALIDAAHAKGMKVMVDVVLNHAGYGTEEYFNKIIKVDGVDANNEQLYKDMIRDTSNTVAGDEKMDSLSGLPDFVTEDSEVRAQLIEWQITWMSKFEIDYYRVDTVKHVDETTWAEFKNELAKIKSEFKLIGEYYDAGFYNDYDQLDSGKMDSILDFHFNDVLSNLASENMAAIEDALNSRNEVLTNTGTMGSFLSSHDENGFLYNLITEYKESESWAEKLMRVAATYQMTEKGQPVIYYGEELGMTGENNYPQQDNRYDFDWNAYENQKNDPNSMYSHYKTMLNIRRAYSEVFAKGERYSVVYPNIQETHANYTTQGYSVFARSYEGTTIYVGTNVWGEDRQVTFYVDGAVGSTYTDLYNGDTYTVQSGGYITITVPGLTDGNGTAVLVRTSGDKETVTDTNTITLKLHYERKTDDYDNNTSDTSDDWNAWVWGEGIKTEGFKFVRENGEMVATITINNARSASFASFRMRQGDWKANDHNAIDQTIDLSNVVSGTVHFYVKQGVWGGTTVLGSDAIIGTKIVNAKYDRNTNSAIITTNRPVAGNVSSAFNFTCVSDKKTLTIKQITENGCVYTVEFEENIAEMSEVIKSYTITFDGFTYSLNMPNIYTTEEFENAYTYDGKDLGLTYDKEAGKFTFKVWAPTADKVTLNVYQTGAKGDNTGKQSFEMTKGDKGVWEYTLGDEYHKYYYTYTVDVLNEQNEVCDPYARTTGVNGDRAMILDLDTTDPEGWKEDAKLNLHKDMKYTDAVIYELHVRDLSIHSSSGVKDEYKGKFLGLTQTGTKTEGGVTTALDHMIELGITHLHLLPIYDYASVDESKLDKPQFNWGYDPLNYNVPEGSYSTDPYNGEVRVKEMKEMIMALHANNINVIMDVVYNHVYDAGSFSVNQIVPNYFSRTNEDGSFSNGSGCGNDTATERDMVHKFVVESILYWHEEYHIDGFRFDLVGLLDTVTINKIVEEVHKIDPDIIFYGEGWTLGTTLSENKKDYLMATQQNAWATDEFAYFSDTLRNDVAGNDTNGQGFIWQKPEKDYSIIDSFLGKPWWCPDPLQTINYASCHDNYTLMDKINVVSGVNYSKGYDYTPGEYQVKLNNLAAAVYMLSEGIPLIHAGEDFLRVKLDETNHVIHNSYNASDYVNQIRWYNLDEKLYKETFEYYKGLIEFRKNHAALRLELASEVSKVVSSKKVADNLLVFKLDGSKVADEVAEEIIIIYNATNAEKYVNIRSDIGASDGTWHVCIDGNKAGKESLYTVNVNANYSWPKVAAHSTMVLVKGATEDHDSVYTRNNNVTITLDKTTLALKENATAALVATVNPANSTLIWTSSNERVAKVDEKGNVTAVGIGSATITVSTLHGVTATCAVTVKELSGVGLNKVNLTLKEDETETLVATTKPAGSAVTWSSSDESVATVDLNGKVTAVGVGTATITATMANGETDSCIVTVTEKEQVPDTPVVPENPPVEPEKPPVEPENPPVEPETPQNPPVKEDVVYVPEEEIQQQVKDEAGRLTEMIENNELEEGVVSEETLEKVQDAIANNKEIITELVIENQKEMEVDKAAKDLVESAVKDLVKDAVSTIAQYLDIKVVLKTEETDEELGTLNKLSEEVTLTFEIPADWKKEGRVFHVIRVHEGKTDVLDVWENGDGTVSFKTDRFSTYALIYTDVEVEEDVTPTPPPTEDAPAITPPSTGDDSIPGTYLFVLLAGIAMVLAGVVVQKRKTTK